MEQPPIADGHLIVPRPEREPLRITHALHHEPHAKHDGAHDVPRRPVPALRPPLHLRHNGGRVQHCHGQRHGPDPQHLEDPEAEEGEEAVALAVEAVVAAGAEDAVEQEAREPRGPAGEEGAGYELPAGRAIFATAEGDGDDGEDDEVGAAGEVWGCGGQWDCVFGVAPKPGGRGRVGV